METSKDTPKNSNHQRPYNQEGLEIEMKDHTKSCNFGEGLVFAQVGEKWISMTMTICIFWLQDLRSGPKSQ